MAVDRAARGVGVDRNAGAVEDAGVIRGHRRPVEHPIEVGGGERLAIEQEVPPAREIQRRRGQPATGPFHGRIPEQPAVGVGGAGGQTEGVAGDRIADGEAGEVAAIRGEGAGQRQRCQKTLAHDFLVAPARHRLDHQSQQDIAGVAVGPAGPGLEQRFPPDHETHQVLGRERRFAGRDVGPGGLECRQVHVIRQAGTMAQQMPDGDAVGVRQSAEPRAVPEMIGQPVRLAQATLALQCQHRRRDEGLADARGQHGRVGRHPAPKLDIGKASRGRDERSVGQRDGRRGAGESMARTEVLERRCQTGREIGAIPCRRGCSRRKTTHHTDNNQKGAHSPTPPPRDPGSSSPA